MSNGTERLLEDLKRHWADQGLRPAQAARPDQIEAFEQRYQLRMPDDLRTYFSSVNGIEAGKLGGMDDEGISFWNLDQVRTVAQELGDAEPRDLFVIADYSLWVHAYAVRLLPDNAGSSEVFLVAGTVPERVADSFATFLRGYLASNQAMLFGVPASHSGCCEGGGSG